MGVFILLAQEVISVGGHHPLRKSSALVSNQQKTAFSALSFFVIIRSNGEKNLVFLHNLLAIQTFKRKRGKKNN